MMFLIKIDISKQLTNIFTKPLAYAQFIGCIRGILGYLTKVHALQARLSAGPGDSGVGAFAGSYIFGPRRIEITSVEHSCEMPRMNVDVPARDAVGRISFHAEKTAQSLYAQLGFRQEGLPYHE